MNTIDRPMIFLAGVRKCGTTSLFHSLSKHSAVVCPYTKEPQLFSMTPSTVAEHLDWYEGLYDTCENRHLLDGSTLHFGSPSAAELIRKHVHRAKVILVLRDPARRAYSAYLHMTKQVPVADSRSFEQLLESLESLIPGLSLQESEDTLLNQAICSGQVQGDFFDEEFFARRYDAPFKTRLVDPLWIFKYFQESSYSKRIEIFSRKFGSNLKTVIFEELIANPSEVLADVLDFLELPMEQEVLEVRETNITVMPRNLIAKQILRLRRDNKVGRRSVRMLKRLGLAGPGRRLKNIFLGSPPKKLAQSNYLRARNLLQDEYSFWTKKHPCTEAYWNRNLCKP